MQVERGKTSVYNSSNVVSLENEFLATDQHLNALTIWPEDGLLLTPFVSVNEFKQQIKQHREILQTTNITLLHNLYFYTNFTQQLISWGSIIIWEWHKVNLWPAGLSYYYILKAQDRVGLQRALGSVYFSNGKLQPEAHQLFVLSSDIKDTFLNISMQYDEIVSNMLHQEFFKTLIKLDTEISQITANEIQSPDLVKGIYWFDTITIMIGNLAKVRVDILRNITDGILEQRNEAVDTMLIYIAELIVAMLMFPFVYYSVKRLTDILNMDITDALFKQSQARFDRRKTEELLHQMLPKQVKKHTRYGN